MLLVISGMHQWQQMNMIYTATCSWREHILFYPPIHFYFVLSHLYLLTSSVCVSLPLPASIRHSPNICYDIFTSLNLLIRHISFCVRYCRQQMNSKSLKALYYGAHKNADKIGTDAKKFIGSRLMKMWHTHTHTRKSVQKCRQDALRYRKR